MLKTLIGVIFLLNISFVTVLTELVFIRRLFTLIVLFLKMVNPLTLFGMARVPKKMKVIIREYVLNEIPKIFAPDEVVNIPEWYLTDEVYNLIYESWKRDCLITEQKSNFLNELYNRARGKHVYQKYDIDANLEFDEHVFESNYQASIYKSKYSHLFRSGTLRKMSRVPKKVSK